MNAKIIYLEEKISAVPCGDIGNSVNVFFDLQLNGYFLHEMQQILVAHQSHTVA